MLIFPCSQKGWLLSVGVMSTSKTCAVFKLVTFPLISQPGISYHSSFLRKNCMWVKFTPLKLLGAHGCPCPCNSYCTVCSKLNFIIKTSAQKHTATQLLHTHFHCILYTQANYYLRLLAGIISHILIPKICFLYGFVSIYICKHNSKLTLFSYLCP